MVELDVVHDDQLGHVVDEFAPLVEEGGVVFVAFEHDVLGIAETRPLAQVFGDAADQITRLQPRAFQNPREQGGGGGLAVGAGDDEVVAAAQEEFLERFGE